jgi:hypothetical protein
LGGAVSVVLVFGPEPADSHDAQDDEDEKGGDEDGWNDVEGI